MSKKIIIVKRSRGGILSLIVLAAALVALAATNPDMTDFEDHVRQEARAGSQGSGILGQVASSIAEGGMGFVARNFYVRRNYVIFSAFLPKSSRNPSYYGFAKLVFIKSEK